MRLPRAFIKGDEELEDIHRSTLEQIIRTARIEALRFEKELVKGLLEGSYEEADKYKAIMDLMTLAFTIGALEKSRKLIVSYVTEHDLASLGMVQKVSLVIGMLMLIFAIPTGFMLYQQLPQLSGLLSVFPLLSFIIPFIPFMVPIFMVSIGGNILWRLTKQSLQKWEDLGKAVIDGIKKVVKWFKEIIK